MSHDPQILHNALMAYGNRRMAYCDDQLFDILQQQARARLQRLLGGPYLETDNALRIEWTSSEEYFDETRFTFSSEPGMDVGCHLLLPKASEGKVPLVVCLQGRQLIALRKGLQQNAPIA